MTSTLHSMDGMILPQAEAHASIFCFGRHRWKLVRAQSGVGPGTARPMAPAPCLKLSGRESRFECFVALNDGEFDGDAFVKVADHNTAHVAQRDWRSKRRFGVRLDRSAGE